MLLALSFILKSETFLSNANLAKKVSVASDTVALKLVNLLVKVLLYCFEVKVTEVIGPVSVKLVNLSPKFNNADKLAVFWIFF